MCACGGDETKLVLEHAPFEVVVTDYLIPGRLNGIDVLRFAKRMNAACQVVVITGNHGPEVREKAIAFGAADYIPKPFSLGIINNAVAQRRRDVPSGLAVAGPPVVDLRRRSACEPFRLGRARGRGC